MIITREDLINYILDGSKSINNAKIGIELELFLCKSKTLTPFTKEDLFKLLDFFPENIWEKTYINNGLKILRSKECTISFEPGLQLEFSSNPENNLHLLYTSYKNFIKDLDNALNKVTGKHFAIGYYPLLHTENIPFLGGERYEFMYKYMSKVGTLGCNMMTNTTTLQTNIDYHNSEDLQKKVQVLANITPFLIYFSASSPFKNGKLTPYLSYRNHVWENTDKSRCGMPEFYFKQQFSIEKYVDHILNIPLYFIIRNNKYILNDKNYTFLDLMQNKFKNFNATLDDFALHLSTIFPDIRLKKYLEIRSCDTMGTNMPLAIPALIVGILYNSSSLEEIFTITKNWSEEIFLTLKNHLNTKGLTNENICDINLVNFATNLLEAAHNGLKERNLNEEQYLYPLKQILTSKTNLAQKYIAIFNIHNNIKDVTKYILNT